MKYIVETVNEYGRHVMFSLVLMSAFLCIAALGVSQGQDVPARAGMAGKALPHLATQAPHLMSSRSNHRRST